VGFICVCSYVQSLISNFVSLGIFFLPFSKQLSNSFFIECIVIFCSLFVFDLFISEMSLFLTSTYVRYDFFLFF